MSMKLMPKVLSEESLSLRDSLESLELVFDCDFMCN